MSLFTFDTERPCPSNITAPVTLTSHVVTCRTVSTVSGAMLTTVNTVPFIYTVCLFGQKIHF